MTTTTISNSINHGIVLGASNYGLTLSIANTGAIHGTTYALVGPSLSSFEMVANSGLIAASEYGVILDSPGSLLNAGSISGGNIAAVEIGYSPAFVYIPPKGGKDYFTNTGHISGGTYGVYLSHVTASNAGTITGGKTGLRMDGEYLLNSNSISGGTFGLAISQGTVSNTGSGHISSPGIGLLGNAANNGGLIINNAASIYGGKAGAYINDGALRNTGTIGSGTIGVWLTASNGTNSGLIYGNTIGVFLYGTADPPQEAFINQSGGTITSAAGFGVSATDIRYVLNIGVITGKLAGVYLDATGITNAGIINGGNAGIGALNAAVYDTGTITGGTYAIVADGAFILDITNTAVLNGKVLDQTGTGALNLSGNGPGSLSGLGTTIDGFSSIGLAPGWTLQGNAAGLAAGQVINGFTTTETIILDNFAANTLDTSYVPGSGLQLTDTSGNHLTLDITGNLSTGDFIVTGAAGDTIIEAVCYLRGTRIATPAGEIPVESLNIGDAVITRFRGYRKIKWIGRQSFARQFVKHNFDQLPVRISAGALGAGLPLRDLFISPGHSMLIDGVLVLAASLVNGITITQNWAPAEIHYYQIEFETHDCVLAEGAWSESYADTPEFRAKFHNAAEFYALYPNHREPQQQSLCAPRPQSGPALAAVLTPLVQRTAAIPGRLHGYIDGIANGTLRGWAWDESNPLLPVQLEILLRNQIIGRILACDYRADLAAAGYGHGRCGFEFSSPLGLPPNAARKVRIRRAQDGAELSCSDHCLARLAA